MLFSCHSRKTALKLLEMLKTLHRKSEAREINRPRLRRVQHVYTGSEPQLLAVM